MRCIFLVLYMILVTSCAKKVDQPFALPIKARSLIAGDSLKTWKLARRFNNGTRMNMGDCFLAHRQSFRINGSFSTDSGGRKDCGEPMLGTWKLARDSEGNAYIRMESDQIPDMMNIEENFKLFKIKKLSDSLLILQFNHAQTTAKQTVMVDYLVPHDMTVEDRTFHW